MMSPSPIQPINSPLLDRKQIKLFIKRDDLIHPSVSGNKWRKLKYNLAQAKELGHTTLLTFGGAFSNHIHAVAAAGKLYGFKTIGIIRGERIAPLNPTLQFAENQEMQLQFVSRTIYRQKNELNYQQALREQYGDFYVLPEGGTNDFALKGCAEVAQEISQQLPIKPTYICTCCGTGGTMAGIIQGVQTDTEVLGIAALKGNFLTKEVESLLADHLPSKKIKWSISNKYHFGGYAKFTPILIDFINQFKQQHGIPLDPIYTGKMLFGIFDLLEKDFFPAGSNIVAIHTGGLQGIAGFNQRYGGLIEGE